MARELLLGLTLALALAASPVHSEPDEAASNQELERRLDALAEEVDDMKLGAVAGELESRFGFGPAASKVYGVDGGVSFGGYGEMLYQNHLDEDESGSPVGRTDAIDYLRQILYFGYRFDDRLLFNSEIEFEHASTGKQGEVSVEFAYIDLLLRPDVNARAGLLLVPMGFINELHEPPTFFGALRPQTESVIIPTTWRANGLGLFGNPGGAAEGLSYRAYIIESLSSVDGENGASYSASGLRGGRQSGSKALMQNAAFTARVDYERSGWLVGGSTFTGGTAQKDTTSTGDTFTGRTTILEAHLQVDFGAMRLRGLLASAFVDEAARINDANGLSGADGVGSRLVGGYIEAGYDILHSRASHSAWKAIPYMRWEQVDPHDQVPEGFLADPARKQRTLTLGAALSPHPQVVVKGDYVSNSNDAGTGVDQWNLALGYHF
jgi:hypothetical protein